MITIKIISSPDKDMLDEFMFLKNTLILGTSSHSDLIINDQGLRREHFKLRVQAEGIVGKNIVKNDFYLLNGKKISGEKKYRPNDEIVIGTTIIKIKSFSLTENNLNDELKKRYEQIDIMMPEVQEILSELEKEMIRLEKELNVSK